MVLAGRPTPTSTHEVILDNGIVRLTLSNPGGLVTGISYGELDNLLEVDNPMDNRGYWDVVWNKVRGVSTIQEDSSEGDMTDDVNSLALDAEKLSNGGFDKLLGTEYKVISDDDNQIEVSFSKKWSSYNDVDGNNVPINIDKRYVLRKGVPGFYTYTIMKRMKGYPGCNVGASRIAFKLSKKFDYMAMSDVRQRYMPSQEDRDNGAVLEYKEAVQLVNPTNPDFNGEVDDKYLYSSENKDTKVHGWVNTEAGVGFWLITPTDEYRSAGLSKQELTSHCGPTALSVFFSAHYAGDTAGIRFEDGEEWEKIMGPVFVYLNQDKEAKVDPTILWKDANARMEKEVAAWPYDFPLSPDFAKADQRGSISGQVKVRDKMTGEVVPAAGAFVGLTRPGGEVGSWQTESKYYHFWSKANDEGKFIINNILSGRYGLYGYVPGYIGEFQLAIDINVIPGSKQKLAPLTFEPPRNGSTLWEIGYPDRTASEFFIPDPPSWVKPHNYSSPVERWRQYGLWERYEELYPKNDLVFTVGTSDYKKDWFFAHVTRKTGEKTYKGTTWQIVFKLEDVKKDEDYTLQIAIASSSYASLEVRINDPSSKPVLGTGMVGRDNAIARHGIHGLYYLYTVSIPGNLLYQGSDNTIYLTQIRATSRFQGLMYDYLRFEGPPPPATSSSKLQLQL